MLCMLPAELHSYNSPPPYAPILLITFATTYLQHAPPHFSASPCLPRCFLSGRLIKGALSNEITPWGLMVWLIDRHTAGED